MPTVRLVRAPSEDADLSMRRFLEFLKAHPNPFVGTRPDELILSAIGDESLFFVERENGDVIATTGFYRHNDRLAEIGSTLIDEAFQGCKLQSVIYFHIITLKWLAEMIDFPTDVFAVVDQKATGSFKNIERCGFHRRNSIPNRLREAFPLGKWQAVESQAKRLYLLPREAIAKSLLFVAAHLREHSLINGEGVHMYDLIVEFPYLILPGADQSLREEANRLSSSQD